MSGDGADPARRAALLAEAKRCAAVFARGRTRVEPSETPPAARQSALALLGQVPVPATPKPLAPEARPGDDDEVRPRRRQARR